jgi:ectoine hydroxylase-related dioxygenase (phytanoyl-CoA dioxygenase family)
MVEAMITTEAKEQFEQKGYHIIRGALTSEEVTVCRQAMLDILQTPADHPYFSSLGITEMPGTPDNPHGIWAGFDMPLFNDLFIDLAYHPNIALPISGLLGPDINLYETSFVSKVPGFPSDYRDWHQDSEYSDPQSNTANVTVIVCLDDMNGDSGATWVVPGTHKLGPIPHVLPTETLTSGAKEVAEKRKYDADGISFDLKAGDALVFLVRLVHKSGANRSDKLQISLAYNYVRKDTLDLKNVTRWVGANMPVVRGGKIYAPRPIV